MTAEPFYILDAIGFLFRSYYAITPMTNAQGASTHALYGFIRSIQKLIKEYNPHYLVAVFDGPNNSASREAIYSDYKSHREGMPEDLVTQLALALTFCKLYGIPFLQVSGVEADDTIGSITKWLEKTSHPVYICSSDKDLCQLVSDHVFVLNTHKNNLLLDKAKVEELFGVRPDQIVDLLAIMGDSSDNIPGIPGFGPKTATKLLQEFGSLHNLLDNIDRLDSAKKQETLRSNKELALISQKLATLNCEVAFPKDEEFFKKTPPHQEELIAFYKEMGFSSLLKELEPPKPSDSPPEDYHCIDSQEKLDDLVKTLSCAKEIALDTETTHLHPLLAELVGIGFSIKPGTAYYVPTNHALPLSHILQTLRPLLENPSISFIGHNLKYDVHVLQNHGIVVKNIGFDTMLASYLLNSQSHQHGLDHLCLTLLDKTKIPIKDLIGQGKQQRSMKEVPFDLITHYCCEDVDYTLRLKHLFAQELQKRHLIPIFTTI
ncbi:MAG: DNA polymerase I, partial [Chlamydiae bacterium]|nr:DNA polymerase I [Chlamydiota bacterium]